MTVHKQRGGGGGAKKVGIYLIKRRQKGMKGVLKSEKLANVVFGWPHLSHYLFLARLHVVCFNSNFFFSFLDGFIYRTCVP